MTLKLSELVHTSDKGTRLYTTEPLPGSSIVHQVLTRQPFPVGSEVVVSPRRGPLSTSCDLEGKHMVLVWWI